MSFNNVDSFLEKIGQIKPVTKSKNFEKKKQIEKVFCNFKGNLGKYQLLPMNSTVSDFPYVTLMGTREVRMPRKNMGSDGAETVYDAWIRILPKSAYKIKDKDSGREVSSLTAEEEAVLDRAYAIFDELYKEVDGREHAMDPVIKNFIRKKNYTIFCAHAMNFWQEGNTRQAARQNFDGLFVVTVKSFMDLVSSNIEDTNITESAINKDWISQTYNRDLTGRRGFVMMSIGANSGGPGFNVSVVHKVSPVPITENADISEEAAQIMENPVELFLGWQAAPSEEGTPSNEKRLFNRRLMEETIQYMTDQLTRIKMEKANGGNTLEEIKKAIDATNKTVLKNQTPTNKQGQATNDPVLASMSGSAQGNTAQGGYDNNNVANNPEQVVGRNTDPFNTPPAAHFDSITGAPVNPGNGQQQYGGSSFGNPTGSDGNNLPF